MTYPIGTPVRERILADLEAVLATIAPPDYKQVVRTVQRWQGNLLTEVSSFPAAILIPTLEDQDDGHAQLVAHTMTIALVLAVEDGGGAWKTTLEDLLADARVAILKDWTRGANALTTRILSTEVWESSPDDAAAGAQMNIQVLYRTLYTDPTEAH